MGGKMNYKFWTALNIACIFLLFALFLGLYFTRLEAQPSAPKDEFGIGLKPMYEFINGNKPYPEEHILLPSAVYLHNEVQNQATAPTKTIAAIGLDVESLRWITRHADKFKENQVVIFLQLTPESNEDKSNLSALQKALGDYPIMPQIPAVLEYYGARKVPCLITTDGKIFE